MRGARPENRRDGRDARARAIRENPDALAERLRARREVRIFGLQDLRRDGARPAGGRRCNSTGFLLCLMLFHTRLQ